MAAVGGAVAAVAAASAIARRCSSTIARSCALAPGWRRLSGNGCLGTVGAGLESLIMRDGCWTGAQRPRTREFEIMAEAMAGKRRFSILGDSISTFEGCNPTGFRVFYEG